LLQTNLQGTLNCLEFARAHVGQTIFLSTSRVYSLQPLKDIALQEGSTRLDISTEQKIEGVSAFGINENFPTHLPRSLYGASKLASELVIQEYVDSFKLKAVINRCGVIAGPGQFGKVDQGVFTLWIANHYFKKPLRYTGFGGTGKQVRDLLHPRDLFSLLKKQSSAMDRCSGDIFNIGGGLEISTSLAEWTMEAERVTGNRVEIPGNPATAHVDVPLYVTDSAKAKKMLAWEPAVSRRMIAEEIGAWLKDNEPSLRELFS
jgi:CDP-paratose 2-epimerase